MSYRLLESYSRQTLVLLAVGVLTLVLVLSCPHSAGAQGELQLPDNPGMISSSSPLSTDMTQGSASRTVSPDVTYSNGGYAATSGGAYSSGGVAYSELLGSHLRARYNTQSYGQTRGNLDLGTMMLYDEGDSGWFFDGQVTLNDDSQVGYNLGIGRRFLTLPLFPGKPGSQKLAGISLWSDGQATINDNFVSQIGVSLEYLGDNWDLRSNIYVPLADTEVGEFTTTTSISYLETFLVQETIAGADEALTVAEVEAARRIGDLEAWGFVGGYSLNGDSTDSAGYKVGLRGYATPDISVQFAITDDDVFGTNAVFTGTWFIGRTRTNTPQRTPVAMRMREPVLRNDYVAIRQTTTVGGATLLGDVDCDGDEEVIRVVHVDSTAPAGGDGSFENPLNTLADVEANSPTTSIVLVHGGSTFTGDAAVLQDGQRLLGEGGGVDHIVVSSTFGNISLPETAVGAQTGAAPTITNAGGDTITLANDTKEVSNLTIIGGSRAVVSPGGVAAVDLNNLTIAGTTGNGVELTPGLRDLDNDGAVDDAIFASTITDVTFSGVGGDDINLDGQSTTVTTGATIANVTSTGGGGTGIVVANTTAATTITGYTNDGGIGAAGGGVLLDNSTGGLAVSDATITNQAGFGVRLNNSDTANTLANMTITDTGGTAFDVVGGPTAVGTTTSFTGTITQNAAAAGLAVSVSGDHAGTITFAEAEADAGVVSATNGGGILFDEAEGSYSFNSAVVLNNATSMANARLVVDDSDDDGESADITFTDATITSPSGDAVQLTGVDSGASINYTGSITQANAASAVSVADTGADGHEGTLLFSASTTGGTVVTANDGDGLQFNNADGGYTFFDTVTLAGGDAGIDIDNSDGTFLFADAAINNPTGVGLDINGGDAVVTYTGSISQFNNAAAVQVVNHGTTTGAPVTSRTGSLILNATASDANLINATNGPGLVFNGADGTYNLNGEVILNGPANVADTGVSITNDSDGAFTFTDTTITNPTGTAFEINGGEADIDFTGFIQQTANNAAAVSITNHETGGVVNFNEVTTDAGVVSATAGTGLRFSNADGQYNFNDAVTLNGGDAGVDILADSDGTFVFDADSEIRNPSGEAFVVAASGADVTYNGTIVDNSGNAVRLSTNDGGSVVFNGTIDSVNAEGIDVVNNTGGVFTFNGAVDLDTTTNDAVTITGNSDTTVAFNAGDVDTTTGDGFLVMNNTDSSVTVGALTIDTTSGNAVDANANTGGGLTLSGVTATTSSSDVIALNNNTGGTASLVGVTASSTSGGGFQIAGTEGLSGAANTSTTGTGIGLSITGSTVANTGLAFDSVTVTNGASGVVLNAVTGGEVSVGVGGSSVGDGGTLNTSGTAVAITDVERAQIANVQITGAGADGFAVVHTSGTASSVTLTGNGIAGTTADGVRVSTTGAGAFDFVATGNTVTTAGSEGIAITLGGSTNDKGVTLTGNTVNNGTGAEALLLNATSGVNNVLVNGSNVFSLNNAAVNTADFNASGTATLNLTVDTNTFANSAASSQPFEVANNGGTVQLAIVNNAATPGTAGDNGFFLVNTAGTFLVEDLNTVGSTPDDQNTVTGGGAFDFDPNPAAFGPAAAGSTPTP